jgi:formylglycine-generating enzyme required for sulfatase activity/tRNA A-37 threonylcarbamoyl transferase component Bud32
MPIWEPEKKSILLQKRFLVEKLLGAGGMGETYLAQDQRMSRSVVLKILNAEQQADAAARQRFSREAEMLAKFQHPGVVTVHDLIEVDGRDVIVMERLDGLDLIAYLSPLGVDRWCYAEAEALEYIRQTGKALAYVHEQGLLHRDIKPHNIMRCGDGQVKLIDFGLARQFDPKLSKLLTNQLTEGYAPIEQYEERGKFTKALDVYALAATLYYLLTGEHPISARLRSLYPLVPPRKINENVSVQVNEAILRGMELAASDRPQTVADFLASLKSSPAAVTKPRSQPVIVPAAKKASPKPLEIPQTPKLTTFSFKTAEVKVKEGFFGGTKIVVQESTGQAKGFSEDLGGGVKLNMIEIPGGEFMMGSPNSEKDSQSWERPQHRVQVPKFYLGQTLVTQAQWQALMGNNPSHFKGANNLPVDSISWLQAKDFCQKLSQKSNDYIYRLPSEAEWEYACRANTTTPFAFGETITPAIVNYDGNYPYATAPKGEYRQKTTPVGSFPANSFGLYDMHGNLWEWCLDEWVDNYKDAPIDGSARGDVNSHSSDTKRLLRGGSWHNVASNCRSGFRDFDSLGYNNVGLRVVAVRARAS